MMRFKAVLSYDGHAYSGYQKQINGRSIQSEIENALMKITRTPTSITASGRTDAGVHALGQVFHFDGPESISPAGYYNALNTLLPKDIRIRSVEQADPDFHARFSAVFKRYEYVITQERDNPFTWRYMNFVWRPLSVSAMKEAAHVFEGEHDFTSFSNAQIDPRKPRVKTVWRIAIRQTGSEIRLIFVGSGFLRYQVRMMAAALIAAGEGRTTSREIAQILGQKDKHAWRHNAPAHGLYLVEVGYSQDELKRTLNALEKEG